MLKVAERTVGLPVVAQRRPAGCNRVGKNLANCDDESLGTISRCTCFFGKEARRALRRKA